MISDNATIIISREVLFHEVEGQAVLLDQESGKYFGLDAVGTRAWNLMALHGRLEPVVRILVQEYAVEEAQLRADLQNLLAGLTANGLVTINDSPEVDET